MAGKKKSKLEKAMGKLQVAINKIRKRADSGYPTHGEMMGWAERLETVMGMVEGHQKEED